MQPGDIFIVDRGFRDAVFDLENRGFIVLMPALKGQQKQLIVEQANSSRFVTKTRWAVESVHGRIKKKFQLLEKLLDNKMLPNMKSYYQITSSLLNKLGKKLVVDEKNNAEILNRMIKRRNEQNTLAVEIEQKG